MKKSTIGKWTVTMLLFALTLIGTMQLKAGAATSTIDSKNVDVNYLYETVTVTTADDTVVYYTENYNKDVSRWDVCEVRNGKAAFDISWINKNKTVRLYLCGDKNKGITSVDVTWEENFGVQFIGTLLTTDITEAAKWQQLYKKYPNFSEETGYLIFTLEENGRENSYFDLDNILWRKGDSGVWREFKELNLREVNIRGIRLEFQIKADNGDKQVPIEGARASSVARLNISSLTAAPKVAVNADTMSVALKNGMEFSFDKKNWYLIPDYSKKFGMTEFLIKETYRENQIEKIYTNQRINSLLIQEILYTQENSFTTNTPMSEAYLKATYGGKFTFSNETGKKGIVVYVREIATEKKAASKISEIIIPYAADDKAEAVQGALKFSYGESKTNTGGIVVENTTKDLKYQVGVITPEDSEYVKIGTAEQNDIDLSDIKWTSVKPGKTLKISNKKVPKGSYMIYRIAGEEGQLPSTYAVSGEMKYDHLTYAAIASDKKSAGQTVLAVVSTNMYDDDGNIRTDLLTFQWQVCANVKVEEPKWDDIAGATGATFTLTKDQNERYIRVMIKDQHGNTMYSDEEGPMKYVAPKEEPEGEVTPTPTP